MHVPSGWKKGVQLDARCGLGAQQGRLLLPMFPGLPVGRGLSFRGGWAPTGSSAVVPREWESDPGETGRKFGFPQRALSTCFLKAGKARGSQEGGKGGLYFSFLFHLLPPLQPQQSWSLISLLPSLVPHTVCVCLLWFLQVSGGPQLSLWSSHPSCFDPTPLGSGAHVLGTGFLPGVCLPDTLFSLCQASEGKVA